MPLYGACAEGDAGEPGDGLARAEERHYELVPAKAVTEEDLKAYSLSAMSDYRGSLWRGRMDKVFIVTVCKTFPVHESTLSLRCFSSSEKADRWIEEQIDEKVRSYDLDREKTHDLFYHAIDIAWQCDSLI